MSHRSRILDMFDHKIPFDITLYANATSEDAYNFLHALVSRGDIKDPGIIKEVKDTESKIVDGWIARATIIPPKE